jgi:phosphatidylserine/phosphatidylglycerophosphate/cardiolipin synthase-like enzyme
VSNTGVRGRVVDSTGAGIADLVVAAYDVEVVLSDELLRNTATRNDPVFPGLVRTDASGNFNISYPSGEYGLEANPDIRVKVYDSVKRPLIETDVHEDVTASVLVLPDIVIPRAHAEGWLVTLGSGTPQRLTPGNSIEFLIDNEEAWPRLSDAVANTDGRIRIQLLLWDVEGSEFLSGANEGLITKFAAGHPSPGSAPTAGTKLEDEVLKANTARGVPVGVIMWDWPFFADFDAESKTLFTKPGSTTTFRSFASEWFTTMHVKSVVLVSASGTEGYLVSSPFLQEYFDAATHKIDDPRRGEFGWLKSSIKLPIHDVSCVLKGPAVADMDATFRLHWEKLNAPGDPALVAIATPPPQPPASSMSMQMVRTVNGDGVFGAIPKGETGILEAYLRAIRNAEDFVYLENQYLTSPEIGDALLLALKQKPQLNIILLINNKLDLPFYNRWQLGVIRNLLKGLTSLERTRLGIFTAWSHEAATPKSRIIRNYVHSKVAIVDDKWATVGSGNLDGASLNTAQHFLLLDTILMGLVPNHRVNARRASELNTVIFNGVDGQPATDAPRTLRSRLWSEHLALPVATLGSPGPKRWLAIWNEQAADKLDALKDSPPRVLPARILPFPREEEEVPSGTDDPDKYLQALGVDTTALKVEEEVREFNFRTAAWA